MNHLLKRNGHYYFRLKVPVDMRDNFPFREIKKSLKTLDAQNAKIVVRSLSYKIDKVFSLIRGDMLTLEQAIKPRPVGFLIYEF